MSFLSFDFAIFVGLALLIFHLAPPRWRLGLLLGLSYAFYLSWSPFHTLLLAAVTVGVYATALWIEGRPTEEGKRALTLVAAMALLVYLFAYKSATWLLTEFFPKGAGSGSNAVMAVIVPLGLSYYVFKMVGYLLDVYWEVMPAQRNFVSFALYGAFFPQIVSGPIQRAQSFFEQTDKIKNPNPADFLAGLRRILFGLFKKVVIADRLGDLVGNIYANPAAFSPLELWAGICFFAIQLYADLSGLTDIAIGLGLLFGLKGPENFELPFFATNIQLFWRRWHMSLTTWLTEYLFTPVRMSLRKLGTTGLCLAIFINMLAIGLWHGTTWKFLTFGIVHGIFVVTSVLTLKPRNLFFKNRPGLSRVRALTAPVITFHLVAFSLVLFRSDTLAAAVGYFEGLIPGWQKTVIPTLRFNLTSLGMSASALLLCGVAFIASEAVTWGALQPSWNKRFFATPILFRRALYSVVVVMVLFLFKGTMAFIYARF